MERFPERVLCDELAEVRKVLEKCLAVLDAHDESEAALYVCHGIEALIGAPSTMEQWYMMTGRNPDGTERPD
ncbi:hypothetical protein BRX37_14220 [Sphingomonas sp. S-NIH.Pt3_0716]|nr:hypothetical protein BRX37_14220 [Sphingomonas sp. S-NIH.Pt3_0716]